MNTPYKYKSTTKCHKKRQGHQLRFEQLQWLTHTWTCERSLSLNCKRTCRAPSSLNSLRASIARSSKSLCDTKPERVTTENRCEWWSTRTDTSFITTLSRNVSTEGKGKKKSINDKWLLQLSVSLQPNLIELYSVVRPHFSLQPARFCRTNHNRCDSATRYVSAPLLCGWEFLMSRSRFPSIEGPSPVPSSHTPDSCYHCLWPSPIYLKKARLLLSQI